MKSRSGLCVVGLFALLGASALGCGGEEDPPNQPPGVVVETPDAPTALTVTPGDGQVTLSWTAPADDGGAPVTQYSVQVLQGGTPPRTETTTSTTLTITGLTNGAEYTFTVTASNRQGAGAASAPSAAAVPFKVLGAPRDVSATPANGAVTVSWSEPEPTGFAVTGYTVTVHEGENVRSTDTTSTSFTATGLTNGTSYSFVVTATNSKGKGAASSAVTSTPRTTPGPSEFGGIAPGERKLNLVWDTPEDNGGSVVTGFRVVIEETSTGRIIEQHVPASASSTGRYRHVVDGLGDVLEYAVTIYAINEAGEGTPSNTVRNVTIIRPGAPLDFAAAVEDATVGRVRLTWHWGHSGGAFLRGCTFTVQPGNRTWNVEYTGAAEPFYVDTATPDGSTYTYSLACSNALGIGEAATIQITVGEL
ncbi:fibronectin type III domain-containing protein [Pyxidicoccus sp. 3LG]